MSALPVDSNISVPDAPSITSLQFLDQILQNVQTQIGTIEKELQTSSSSTSSSNSAASIGQIKELYAKVVAIKRNAVTVAALSDKLKEDRNLTSSVNSKLGASADTLKGVNKVIETIKELETEIKNGEFDYFRILAEMFNNVLTQIAQFECFGALPHIKLIQAKVSAIEAELKRKVQWSVREIGQLVHGDAEVNPNFPGPEVNVDEATIGQVYLVVDVLGLEFRKDLSTRIAQLQLIPYEKAFKLGTKFCGIAHLEKRFVWFRMLLKVYENKLGHLFPKKWCLPHYFFIEFSRRTKKHIDDYLTYQEKMMEEKVDLHQRVADMLLSLKSLISFEAEMKAYFSVYIRGEDVDSNILDVKEPMAEAFDPFLGPYIQEERKELESFVEKRSIEEMKQMNSVNTSSVNLGVTQPIFESAQKMFENIKASLKRCNTFSSGVTYLALSKEFRVCLHNYALSLKFRHPSPVSAKAGEKPIYEISKYMEVQLCRLIKTGDYCIQTMPQLEEKMKEHIVEEFKDQISFTDETDVFQDMISETIVLINIGIMEKIYPLLGKQGMRAIDWSKDQNIGDESQYMKKIFLILNDTIPRIRLNLSTVYFQQFCMKLSATILDGYLENIMKLKHISQTGSSQLLLDCNGLENYLNQMPQRYLPVSEHDKYPISKVYTSSVSNNVNKTKIILKLLCIEDDQFEEMFKLMWPTGTKKDHDDLLEVRARATFIPHAVKDGVKAIAGTVQNTAVGQAVKNTTQKVDKGITNSLGDFKAAFSMNLFDDDKPKSKPATSGGSNSTINNSNNSSNSSNNNNSTTNNNSPKSGVASATNGGTANASQTRPMAASTPSATSKSTTSGQPLYASNPTPSNNNNNNNSTSRPSTANSTSSTASTPISNNRPPAAQNINQNTPGGAIANTRSSNPTAPSATSTSNNNNSNNNAPKSPAPSASSTGARPAVSPATQSNNNNNSSSGSGIFGSLGFDFGGTKK